MLKQIVLDALERWSETIRERQVVPDRSFSRVAKDVEAAFEKTIVTPRVPTPKEKFINATSKGRKSTKRK